MTDFLSSPEAVKKSMCRYIFDRTLYNIFPIASCSFKDICYKSNIFDLFCLCFSDELTRTYS